MDFRVALYMVGTRHTVYLWVDDDECPVLEFLEMLRRTDPELERFVAQLLQEVANVGVPLHNKEKAELVRTGNGPKEIIELKKHKSRARLFGFYHGADKEAVILTHGWTKGSRQSAQIGRAEGILALYRSPDARLVVVEEEGESQ